MKNINKYIGELYKDKVSIGDLQSSLLSASLQAETGGATSPKDQKIQELIYNYLQVNKDKLGPEILDSFSPMLAWICVGKEVGKFLSLAPEVSLDDLIAWAEENNFNLDISS